MINNIFYALVRVENGNVKEVFIINDNFKVIKRNFKYLSSIFLTNKEDLSTLKILVIEKEDIFDFLRYDNDICNFLEMYSNGGVTIYGK